MKHDHPTQIMIGMRAKFSGQVATGVIYTAFHHPGIQANVVTTKFSDWATNGRDYRVAVE